MILETIPICPMSSTLMPVCSRDLPEGTMIRTVPWIESFPVYRSVFSAAESWSRFTMVNLRACGSSAKSISISAVVPKKKLAWK